MGYDMDDVLNSFFNSKPVAKYTEAEIDEARRRQKKNGGTLMENLEAIKPQKQDKPQSVMPSAVNSAEDIRAMVKDMNKNLASDYSVKPNTPEIKVTPDALGSFKGVDEVLKEKVYGQDDFIKKLIIAFKRPYVSERDENDALNSIYITGPDCSGKHYTLELLVNEIASRGIIPSGDICTLDLSIYPTQTEEKLFLQDLYSALNGKASVLIFENYDNCYIAMLNHISSLVATGECRLAERYVMQNGQLVSVTNALAGNVIGSLSAKDKYFVFVSNKSVDKLAGVMGAKFVNALGDICETAKLDEDSYKKISSTQEKQLADKCLKQLAFKLDYDDSFREYMLNQTSRNRGLRGMLNAYSDMQKALTEYKLEADEADVDTLKLICKEGTVCAVARDKEISLAEYLPKGYGGEIDRIREELDDIVGLKGVKDYILSLEEYYGTQKKRLEAGLKAGEVNKHMIFTGNPGTGKTTIARIVSKYLKAIGVLSGGQLVEVSRADLVGRYIGHTAPLVNQVIKSALGGVLFIDEAYSLNRGREDSFGLEAIDTLVKGIEDNRDNLVVILAGYSNEMEDFLETNSGLKSRFPNIIDFPDYTGEELLEISDITAKSKGYVIDSSVREQLLSYYNMVQCTNAREAGNGRLVRNKIEQAILNQSRRLVAEPDADMTLLTDKDFELGE